MRIKMTTLRLATTTTTTLLRIRRLWVAMRPGADVEGEGGAEDEADADEVGEDGQN